MDADHLTVRSRDGKLYRIPVERYIKARISEKSTNSSRYVFTLPRPPCKEADDVCAYVTNRK